MDNAKSNYLKCLGLETRTSVDNEDIIMGFRGNCSLSASAHKSKSLTINGQRWSNVSDCAAPEGSKGYKTTVYLLKWKCLLWVFYNDAFTESLIYGIAPKGQLVFLTWASNRFNGVSAQQARAVYLICILFPGFSNASVLSSLKTFAEIMDCTRSIRVQYFSKVQFY